MKVVVVGIDALDREVVDRHLDRLPAFRRLLEEGARVPLVSVFPPDSDTAWASIYTAEDPAKHGVLNFKDALSKSADHHAHDVDNATIRGRTTWDVASRAGKRVCVLHPHLGYPPWKVNGLMVGRSSVSDGVAAEPAQPLPEGLRLERLQLPRGFPDASDRGDYLERHRRLVDAQEEISLALYAQEPWDLFWVYSSSVDMVKHFFWAFCDPADPSFKPNPWQDAVRDLYVQHDRWIGRLMDAARPDTAFVVVGDHGHGRRPTRVVHLNEVLRRRGFLAPTGGVKGPYARAVETLKGQALRVVGRFHLENLAAKALKRVPGARKVFTAPPSIDWQRTEAYMSDLSGIKAYSYGGIRLRADLPPERREALRRAIVEEIRSLAEPETGRPIAQWVGYPEDIYQGPRLGEYPDVLYQLRDEWGASSAVGKGLHGTSPSQSLVPGTHRMDTPEFLVWGAQALPREAPARMMDVGATVLDLLGIPARDVDGRPVTRRSGT